jgi:hypothetical protein
VIKISFRRITAAADTRLRLVDAFIGRGQRPNELPDWERADVVEWLR